MDSVVNAVVSFAMIARKLSDLSHSTGCISRLRGAECGVPVTSGAIRCVTQKGRSEGKSRAAESDALAYLSAHGGCSCGGTGEQRKGGGNGGGRKIATPAESLDMLKVRVKAVQDGNLPDCILAEQRAKIAIAVQGLRARQDVLIVQIVGHEEAIATCKSQVEEIDLILHTVNPTDATDATATVVD